MATQFFKPTAAGIVLAVMLLAVQGILGTSGGTIVGGAQSSAYTDFGFPTAVTVTTTFGTGTPTRSTTVHWHWLLLILGGIYCLAMPVGRFITGPREFAGLRRGWRQPAVTLLQVVMGVVIASFVGALFVSRWYWGYWMFPPAMDQRVATARRVVSATHVYPLPAVGEAPARLEFLAVDPQFGPSEKVPLDEDYPFRGRDLLALRKGGAMPAQPATMPVERLDPFYRSLQNSEVLLVDGSGGTEIEGTVFELEGSAGEPLLFVSGNGSQVSNDHYPYYEMLFSAADPAKPVLLSSRRFYYDVAGMEGAQWHVILIVCAALGILLIIPLAVLVMAIRRLREWRRLGGGFPIELATAPIANDVAGAAPPQ
jgi:hypothetical protein